MLLKWIHASVASHFSARVSDFFVQGQPRQEKSNYALMYFSSPLLKECVRDFSLIKISIIVVVSTVMGTNLYRHTEHVGEVQAAFSDIPILDDLGNQVGCLQLRDGLSITAQPKNPDVDVLQTLVDGKYQFFYEGVLKC